MSSSYSRSWSNAWALRQRSRPPLFNSPRSPELRASPGDRVLARQPWKVATLLWAAVKQALIPVPLHELVARLPALTRRLQGYDDATLTRQVEVFAAPSRKRQD